MKSKIIYNSVLALLVLSLFSSIKVYISLIDQFSLIYYFNRETFDKDINEVLSWQDTYPNITVTTLPLKDVKARHFIQNDCLALAKTHLIGQKDHNPFLGFHDMQISDLYWKAGEIDSSYIYAKKAFEALPNNEYHTAYYIERGLKSKKFREIDSIFKKVSKRERYPEWYLYIYGIINSKSYDENYIDSILSQAFNKFTYSDYLSANFKIFKYKDTFSIANELENKALKFYQEKKYEEALESYEAASSLIPEEYTYYENAARCLLSLDRYDEALAKINIIENDTLIKNPKNGAYNFYKALAYIKQNKKIIACKELEISIERGHEEAKKLQKQICSF